MRRICARIQAHPSRAHLHEQLAYSLAPLHVEVSLHASEPPNPLHGYQQALTDPPDCTHLLVVQDDVRVCNDFAATLEKVVKHKREDPIALFLAHLPRADYVAALRALKSGRNFVILRGRGFCPVVAVVWPIEKSQLFLEWTKTARLPGGKTPRSDDAAVGHWVQHTKNRVLACVPSIVQHPDEEDSIIGIRKHWGRDKSRTSEIFDPAADLIEWGA